MLKILALILLAIAVLSVWTLTVVSLTNLAFRLYDKWVERKEDEEFRKVVASTDADILMKFSAWYTSQGDHVNAVRLKDLALKRRVLY